jgi:hypothetical protein
MIEFKHSPYINTVSHLGWYFDFYGQYSLVCQLLRDLTTVKGYNNSCQTMKWDLALSQKTY